MRLILILLLLILFPSFAFADMLTVIVAPETLQFNIKNPSGLITGYNNGAVQKQIPYLDYYHSGVDGAQNPPESPYDTFYKIDYHRMDLPISMATGQYFLSLYNTSANSILAQIMIDLRWTKRTGYLVTNFGTRLIYPNSTWTFEFIIPATPPAAMAQLAPGGPSYAFIPLIKVANSNDLIKDITTAGQLGYLGNTKFVNELIREIQEIEKERTEVRKQNDREKEHLTPAQKAIKEYKELLKEITEKYQKPEADEFVKQEAYTVLKEDLDYIISHIQ